MNRRPTRRVRRRSSGRSFWATRGWLFVLGMLITPPSIAQTKSEGPPRGGSDKRDEIVVSGRRGTALDLDRLVRTRATFFRYRHVHAPEAALYFEVTSVRGLSLDDLRLTLRQNDAVVEIALDASNRFTLPDLPGTGWTLTRNRGRGSIAIRALVLSPDATEADRPLGDVRLQCRVNRTLNRSSMTLGARLAFDVVGACTSRRVAMHLYASRPLLRATVRRGEVEGDLAVDPDGRHYVAPVSDATLPDGARVRLFYR